MDIGMSVKINLETFYQNTAKLADMDKYIQKVQQMDVNGREVVLTGQAPIWLYLKIAHALHGKAKKLIYESPVTGKVVIFDHDPF